MFSFKVAICSTPSRQFSVCILFVGPADAKLNHVSVIRTNFDHAPLSVYAAIIFSVIELGPSCVEIANAPLGIFGGERGENALYDKKTKSVHGGRTPRADKNTLSALAR